MRGIAGQSPPVPSTFAGTVGSWLSFQHFLYTEGHPTFDSARVYVATEAYDSLVYWNSLGTAGRMVEAGVDLSAFDGQRVSLVFEFDTGNAANNLGEGWVVDDVAVSTEAVPENGFQLVVDVRGAPAGRGRVAVDSPPGASCDDLGGVDATCVLPPYAAGTLVTLTGGPQAWTASSPGWTGVVPLLLPRAR